MLKLITLIWAIFSDKYVLNGTVNLLFTGQILSDGIIGDTRYIHEEIPRSAPGLSCSRELAEGNQSCCAQCERAFTVFFLSSKKA